MTASTPSPFFRTATDPAGPSARWSPPEADALVAFLSGGPDRPAVVHAGVRAWVASQGVTVEERLSRAEARGRAGEVLTLELDGTSEQPRTIHLVGIGAGSTDELRRAGAAAARASRRSARVAALVAPGDRPERTAALVEGWSLAAYRFHRRSAEPPKVTEEVVLLAPAGRRRALAAAVQRAVHRADAVRFARDLANTPSNEKSPAWMLEQARAVADVAGLRLEVVEGDALVAAGFGGVLAVGQGSAMPPLVLRLDHRPKGAPADAAPIVLVGKGITFDSGGLSLKPADFMTMMKTDMSGAGVVLACMRALPALGVRTPVTALVALAENMPSGASFRPGDVVTHVGGRTSEIVNTDAEGRLVLADLLAYADRALEPDTIVDVATLTGAASVGLGRIHGALYANRPAVSRALLAAAKDAGEPLWPMPLVEEYRSSLDSTVADLRHVGNAAVQGGSITAALFLREFVGDRAWAHLDIAGPARSEADRHEVTRGGTGYGVRTLLSWLTALTR